MVCFVLFLFCQTFTGLRKMDSILRPNSRMLSILGYRKSKKNITAKKTPLSTTSFNTESNSNNKRKCSIEIVVRLVKKSKPSTKPEHLQINKENESYANLEVRHENTTTKQTDNKQQLSTIVNSGHNNTLSTTDHHQKQQQQQDQQYSRKPTTITDYWSIKPKESIQCTGNNLNGSSNMSIYEFSPFDSASNSGNGLTTIGSSSKYISSKNTNVDAYYGGDTKQQLSDIAMSMASLCNIGNSCYMNSAVYALRFTPSFLHNLHHLVNNLTQILSKKDTQMKLKSASLGRNVSGLQGQNSRSYSSKDLVSLGSSSSSSSSSPASEIVKTTQQSAMEKLHELFKSLTGSELSESPEPYQSEAFLKAIQEVNPIFEGNQQQDAHELLMCILDSVRESCKIQKKIITDHPEIIVSG